MARLPMCQIEQNVSHKNDCSGCFLTRSDNERQKGRSKRSGESYPVGGKTAAGVRRRHRLLVSSAADIKLPMKPSRQRLLWPLRALYVDFRLGACAESHTHFGTAT
jgi:hypothetical protein